MKENFIAGSRKLAGHSEEPRSPSSDRQETSKLVYMPIEARYNPTLGQLKVRVPPDNVADPGAKNSIVPPSSIKATTLGSPNPNVRGVLTNFFPADSSVILEATPNVTSNGVKGPSFVVETAGVSCYPNFPQSDAAQEGPNGGKFSKASREPLRENAVMPVEVEVNKEVARTSLQRVEEGGAPLPCAVSLIAIPKTVKDGFGEAGAERA